MGKGWILTSGAPSCSQHKPKWDRESPTPLSKGEDHTWKAGWCSGIRLARCTQHSARLRAGAQWLLAERRGLEKKCPQTQLGANCQRQFSQLHCSCHHAFSVAGSLYYSETESFTSSCVDRTECMR